jgi:hypothetical protein
MLQISKIGLTIKRFFSLLSLQPYLLSTFCLRQPALAHESGARGFPLGCGIQGALSIISQESVLLD